MRENERGNKRSIVTNNILLLISMSDYLFCDCAHLWDLKKAFCIWSKGFCVYICILYKSQNCLTFVLQCCFG
jgi:hypothetical protein